MQITTPENGAVAVAGTYVNVTVKAAAEAFQSVIIAGEGPFSLAVSLTKPPYTHSFLIPADAAAGRYVLKATGTTASGDTFRSDPVEMDIERPDKASKLQSERPTLTFGDEKDLELLIWGIFPDGSKTDVTRSRRTTYTSDKPDVAVVSNEGAVSAIGAGKARITVKYDDKIVVVPVVVARNPIRDVPPKMREAKR